MKEKIQSIKVMFDNGVNRETFLKMILHCTDYYEEKPLAWANYLKLDKWQELFAKKPNPGLELSQGQLSLFFDYMSKYHGNYIGRNNDIYYVYKNFSNELRTENNFEFESAIFLTIEIL